MTLTDTKIYVSLLLCALLSACASTPLPRLTLDRAEQAVQRANRAGAAEQAPTELNAAISQLRQAEAFYAEREAENADAAAMQAEANAQLAVAKARAAQSQASVQQKTEENARLRRDLLGESGDGS